MAEEIRYKGIPASPGISISKAYLFKKGEPVIAGSDGLPVMDVDDEINEFENSIKLSLKELKKIYELSKEKIGEENSKIFDVQIEVLNDKIFIETIKHRIARERKTAGYIFEDEITRLNNIILASNDEYLKERFVDINDVKNRVIRNMRREKLVSRVEENSIIVSHELTPADTILFSRRKVQGYITDIGGVTSHAAIISRALRVPAVVGAKPAASKIITGDFLIIDGFNGIVIKNPAAETIEEYEKIIASKKDYEKRLYEVIDLPSETLDGKKVELSANIEFDEEIDFITKYGHCSIGLYRTEHLFLEAGDFPSEGYQVDEYTHISNVTYPNNVVIRTYDIGGDKLLPGSQKEDNPFLGWRGIRLCLDKISIFKEQLCAILKSSSKKNVKILFPMISSLEELRKAKETLAEVKSELREAGIKFDKDIETGIMIEVPSAYFIADELAREVDFFSIGTNDLIQYILAVDRGNELVSNLFQPFHPAVIRAIHSVVKAAHKNKIKVSLCGEMASDPKAAILLIGLGVDELSVVPLIFPEIKTIIRMLKYDEVQRLADKVLKLDTEKAIRNEVLKFFEEKVDLSSLTSSGSILI